MTAAAERATGLTPLFESALGRGLGAAVDGGDVPLVSVIVRSMDRPTLAEALASLAAQTYPNIEAVVVNAKGGPHTPLPELRGRLHLRLVENGEALNRGRAANAGLDAARGEYIALLDDDDTLDPDHLSTLVAALRGEGERAVAYAGVRCMDRNDAERKVTRIFGEAFAGTAQLLAANFIPSHAALFHRRLIQNGARFDETLELYEDWDFWLQLSAVARFTYVDRISATYFTGGTSQVSPADSDAAAVRRALETFYAKWKARITLEEFRALGELYHRAADQVRRKEREIALYVQQLAAAEAQLAAVLASRSWRLTQPLRAASVAYRELREAVRRRLGPLLRPARSRIRRR